MEMNTMVSVTLSADAKPWVAGKFNQYKLQGACIDRLSQWLRAAFVFMVEYLRVVLGVMRLRNW